MWSIDFWRTMLDEMARHRYNALTLWNLHPFPSIVQVPEFPEVALDDVLRAKPGSLDERFSHSGRDMFRPELLDGAEVVKRLSIRDKIAFWREVIPADHPFRLGQYRPPLVSGSLSQPSDLSRLLHRAGVHRARSHAG